LRKRRRYRVSVRSAVKYDLSGDLEPLTPK